jgi:iron complex outermembrane receptor protein
LSLSKTNIKNGANPHSGQSRATGYFKPSVLALAILHCSPLLAATGSEADNSGSVMTITADAADENPVEYGATQASTATKTDTPLIETPQSVSVVTQSMIEDYQVTSLDDAMKFVSGVTQGNTLGGTEDGFVKRGFGANSDGSILLDGVRSNQGLGFDATTDHVEVLKGSASLLYGIQNPGGVINVISKKPQYEWNTRVSGRNGGSGGGAGTLDVTGPLGNGFAFRFIAERQSEDYWRNFGKDQHTLLAPSLSWYGEKASFNISYQEYKYDIPYDRGTAFINGKPLSIPYERRLDELANHAWGKNKRLNTTWEYELSPDWKTRFTYAWMQRRYDSNEVRATAINTTTGAVTRRADANRGFNHQTSLTSWDWIGEPEVLGMKHDLLIGADYEKVETYKQYSYRGKVNSNFNMYDPVYGVSPITNGSTYSDSNSNLRSTLFNHSVYAKDSIHFTDHWIGVIGGRYQHYNQKGSSGFVTPAETQNDTANKFLPQVGLVYMLNDSLSFYGNFSKSFTPSTDVDDDGNTAQPELGTTYEIGSKWQISPRLDATVALYRIDEKDMSVYINGVTRNIPKARSSGVELELNGEIAKDWSVSANYAYDKTEIVEDNVSQNNVGNRLVNAPTNMGSLYVSHTLRWLPVPGDIRLGGGARYVGTRAGDPENSFTMPAYTVADAFITWDNALLGKHTQLRLNVNNIFNKEYYTSSAGNLRVEEGETRNVVLSASVDF